VAFLSSCLQQFHYPDLEYSWEVLYKPRKPFSPKSYPELRTEAVDALEGRWLLRFPTYQGEFKRFRQFRYNLCDYPRLKHEVYLVLTTTGTQNMIRKCNRNRFSQMCYEAFVFSMCSWLESVGKLVNGDGGLVRRVV